MGKVIDIEAKREVRVDVAKLVEQNIELRNLLKQWQVVGATFVSEVKAALEGMEKAQFTLRLSNPEAYTALMDATGRLESLVVGG